MKKFLPVLASCGAIMVTCVGAFAQNATTLTTVPVGYVSIPLTEKNLTIMSLPLQPAAVYASKATSVGNATITDTAANFSTLGNLTNTHYVRIKSGNAAGREFVVTSVSGNNTLTLSTGNNGFFIPVTGNGTAVSVAANDQYELVPMYTLAGVFGSVPADLTLTSNATSTAADQVTIYVDGTQATYYHNGANWKNASNSGDPANYNTAGIPPHAGIVISRRPGGAPAELTFQGTVASTAARYQLPGGARVAVPISSPVGTTLQQLNFASLADWTKNASPTLADQVTVYRPDKTMSSYFHNGTTWRNAGNSGDSVDYATVSIPAGSGLWIIRRGASTGTAANVASQLPYSL